MQTLTTPVTLDATPEAMLNDNRGCGFVSKPFTNSHHGSIPYHCSIQVDSSVACHSVKRATGSIACSIVGCIEKLVPYHIISSPPLGNLPPYHTHLVVALHNNNNDNNNYYYYYCMTVHAMSRIVLKHLRRIAQRLQDQDETLQTVCLWPETKPVLSSTYISMFLEETTIQQALQDCLQACATSTVLRALRLGNLPEPDLEAALLTLARGMAGGEAHNAVPSSAALTLKELYIGPLTASSSVSGNVLTKLLETLAGSSLQVLDCPCRIRLNNQASVDTLAQAFTKLPRLSQLYIHVIPRTSIEQPALFLDTLLQATSDLECLELVAGYPEHNPYQKPILRNHNSLTTMIQRNPALRVLTLANFGLHDAHVQALFQGPWPNALQHFSLPFNAQLTENWGETLAKLMQDPSRTNLVNVEVPHPCLAVNICTTLNRLGRSKLTNTTEGTAAHQQAWQNLIVNTPENCSGRLCLNVCYALIREHPLLAVQTMAPR